MKNYSVFNISVSNPALVIGWVAFAWWIDLGYLKLKGRWFGRFLWHWGFSPFLFPGCGYWRGLFLGFSLRNQQRVFSLSFLLPSLLHADDALGSSEKFDHLSATSRLFSLLSSVQFCLGCSLFFVLSIVSRLVIRWTIRLRFYDGLLACIMLCFFGLDFSCSSCTDGRTDWLISSLLLAYLLLLFGTAEMLW